jgi:hypothetical protein
MPGSNSSAPASAAAERVSALALTVHSVAVPEADAIARRTARGRLQMILLLLACASPVVASYLAYFGFFRPEGRTNYGDLISPARPMPGALALRTLDGQPVPASSLQGQWLLVVVSGGACDAACERHLWVQRQLVESLGVDAVRVDKVWLVDDGATPRSATLAGVASGRHPATVLRVPAAELGGWLDPAAHAALADHYYIVDPRGAWMLRSPRETEPARLKRDLERLLRASAGWDRPGR